MHPGRPGPLGCSEVLDVPNSTLGTRTQPGMPPCLTQDSRSLGFTQAEIWLPLAVRTGPKEKSNNFKWTHCQRTAQTTSDNVGLLHFAVLPTCIKTIEQHVVMVPLNHTLRLFPIHLCPQQHGCEGQVRYLSKCPTREETETHFWAPNTVLSGWE